MLALVLKYRCGEVANLSGSWSQVKKDLQQINIHSKNSIWTNNNL